MSEKRFRIFTVLLILIIIFCMKGTVMSRENKQRAEENRYFLTLEQEYVQSTREYLREQGFHNCGVMMTRVTYEDGSRESTVRLHHRKLTGMTGGDKRTLMNRLSQAEFGHETCIFKYDL